ncbi:MAG: BspA family leucine-rich repeat surface protein [Coriobacteriia bacterium]|nr:BspA family leucine-rich repeat surface protein [Coriobacteriia bacterium]
MDDYKINITAVFISNETNGYVAFSVNDSREGTFTFYYGVGTEAAASKYVPSGEKLISVFDVKSNTSDYDLPSWYRKYQESWHENDNHPIPKFVKVIEDNVDNNKLYVRFDKTFTEFKELRSMSCWFMGALSHIDESVLFNPFNLDSADHFAGLENIDTGNISNVAYMFGGHEYFNDLHGSKNTKIYLENFDVKGNIKNLSGLFANLPKLTELYVGDKCFYGMKNVYSTSKMFYNTPLLEKAELNWLNTQEVSEMEYMFGNTVEQIPSEAALDVSKLILPSNFVITEKVKSLEGIFCGYADCKEFEVKFDKCKSSSSFNQIENMSYMFQNCCHATRISVSGTNNLTSASVTNMSHMYENCTKINSVTSQDEQIPTELTMINAVTDFSYMFAGCSSLNRYSLMRETSPAYLIQSAAYMFSDCPNLKDVEFAGNYNWFYVDDFDNYYRSTGAVNMFANLDGTLNSTLEHFTYDTNAWNSAISFAAAGLAYVNGNNPIGWINSKSMYYDISTRMPDIVPVPSTNDINMVTFDRMTTNYYFKLSSNSAGFAYGE